MVDEIYKSAKLNGKGHARSNGHTASVEDTPEDDDDVAGPEMPPELEDEGGNDEEGRFFGGGISTDTAEVLDFIDERDIQATAVRKFMRAQVALRLSTSLETRKNRFCLGKTTSPQF